MKKFFIIKNIKARYLFIYLILIITTISMIGVGLLQPYVFKQILDSVFSKDLGVLKKYIIYLLIIFIISQLLVSITMYLKAKLTEDILVDLRSTLYKSILDKDLCFLKSMNTGEILNRILNELSSIITFLVKCTLDILTTFITSLGLFIIMFNLSFKITLIIILLTTPYLIATFLFSEIYKKNENKIAVKYSEVNNDLHENILNIKTIKYLNAYDYACENTNKSIRNFRDLKLNYTKITIIINIFMSVLAYAPYIALLIIGFKNVYSGIISLGTVIALINYLEQLMVQFNSIKNINIQFQQFKVLSNRLEDILDKYSNKKDEKFSNNLINTKINDLKINVSDLSLIFDNKLLFNITQEFKLGDIILIVGENGAGKSSFINLLCGLIKPNKGTVEINDVNIDSISYNMKKLIFAVCPQKIDLFSGSVKDNLLLGKNLSDDVIISKINEINLFKIDKTFLNKKVLSRGVNLSGGQIQKIGILRALLMDSKILILDESNSFLDIESKNKLYRYIEDNRKKYITFIVSNEINKNLYYTKELKI